MSKYHSRKVKSAGMKFDSVKEYKRFCDLINMQGAGCISDLKRQVRFQLLPSQKDENVKVIERPVFYVADFVYIQDGETVVEDTKGFRTADYILKRKMMLYFHGIRIKEV